MTLLLLAIDISWIKGDDELKDFIDNVLVEAHGILGDLIIFGVILTIYDTYKKNQEKDEKKENERFDKITKIVYELNDYEQWNSEEAKYRVWGCIKRLERLDYSSISLNDYFLQDSKITLLNFKQASFNNTRLNDSYFNKIKFIKCRFSGVNFENCVFKNQVMIDCDLSYCYLSGACFSEVNIQNVNLQNSELSGVIFDDLSIINGLNKESKFFIKNLYEVLRYSEYENIYSKIKYYESFIKNKDNFFLVLKSSAEEYKKNNKRIIKE